MTQQFADFAKALSGPNGPNREKDVDMDNFVKEMTAPKDTAITGVGVVPPTTAAASTTKEKNSTPRVVCKVNNKLPKHITTNVEVCAKLKISDTKCYLCYFLKNRQ